MQQKEFPIFIKWPNDLYGRLPAGELVKLGGILVNSSVCSGIFTLIVGCGFNVDNREPTTSFNALRQAQGLPPVRQEIVLGAVLGEFNRLYRQFCAGQRSFKPFLDDYYRYWLHSEQRVCIGKSVSLAGEPEMTLPGDGGDMAVISGLTDEGYLVAQSISNPSVRYELLPGRNSFNLTDGMISRKNCNAS
jgi:biotin--protein ligase